MKLAEDIYNLCSVFPKEEVYGLCSQLKKCAISVPSNISEGAGRATNAQFKYFLEISMGSCNEIQTQVELSVRLNYITREDGDKIMDEAYQVYRMILAFYNTLQ